MTLDSSFDSAREPARFDLAALRHDLLDSTPALLNVLHIFHPWLADMRARLRAAVEAGNTPQLAATIHTLRGGLAQLRARSAVELVRQIEAVCKANPTVPFAADDPGLLALDAELEALAAEMTTFLARAQPVVPPRQS
jgi:HPt (histidine-containing phosphotransfer) domain-containing protein